MSIPSEAVILLKLDANIPLAFQTGTVNGTIYRNNVSNVLGRDGSQNWNILKIMILFVSKNFVG